MEQISALDVPPHGDIVMKNIFMHNVDGDQIPISATAVFIGASSPVFSSFSFEGIRVPSIVSTGGSILGLSISNGTNNCPLCTSADLSYNVTVKSISIGNQANVTTGQSGIFLDLFPSIVSR